MVLRYLKLNLLCLIGLSAEKNLMTKKKVPFFVSFVEVVVKTFFNQVEINHLIELIFRKILSGERIGIITL